MSFRRFIHLCQDFRYGVVAPLDRIWIVVAEDRDDSRASSLGLARGEMPQCRRCDPLKWLNFCGGAAQNGGARHPEYDTRRFILCDGEGFRVLHFKKPFGSVLAHPGH